MAACGNNAAMESEVPLAIVLDDGQPGFFLLPSIPIVVALVDDEEATLKYIRKKGNSIALEPANATYEIRIFHSY